MPGLRLDEHVPEALRTPEVDGEDEPAERDGREGDEIAELDEPSILADRSSSVARK